MVLTKLSKLAEFCNGKFNTDTDIVGISTDSRTVKDGELFVALCGERFDGHEYIESALKNGAKAVLCSRAPSINCPYIIVPDTTAALQDIAKCYKMLFSVKTVAVTGSVGKTTTKEFVASVLGEKFNTLKNEGNLNNGIGVPKTILNLSCEHSAAVIEMGMNHFGEISVLTNIVKPDVAVITNIGMSHIEYLGSREGILKAKLEILEGLNENGVVILNGDEPLLRGINTSAKVIYVGVYNNDCDIKADNIKEYDTYTEFDISGIRYFIPTLGIHNVYNALVAYAVGMVFNMTSDEIKKGLADFKNVGMRQNTYKLGKHFIIEDCYNASPESMKAALKLLASKNGKKIAVLGDMLELGEYTEQAHREIGKIAASCCDTLICYGNYANYYKDGALTSGLSNVIILDTYKEIADILLKVNESSNILFKGSRGMKLEEAISLFREGMIK